MPSQNGNAGRNGPWGGGPAAAPDLEDLVRQAQAWLKRIMPSGGPRGDHRLFSTRRGCPGRMDGLLHGAERLRRGRATFRQIPQGRATLHMSGPYEEAECRSVSDSIWSTSVRSRHP
jgi:hypothetical protein